MLRKPRLGLLLLLILTVPVLARNWDSLSTAKMWMAIIGISGLLAMAFFAKIRKHPKAS
jgi:hypothetical protein